MSELPELPELELPEPELLLWTAPAASGIIINAVSNASITAPPRPPFPQRALPLVSPSRLVVPQSALNLSSRPGFVCFAMSAFSLPVSARAAVAVDCRIDWAQFRTR